MTEMSGSSTLTLLQEYDIWDRVAIAQAENDFDHGKSLRTQTWQVESARKAVRT